MIERVAMYLPRARHGDGGVTNSFWLWVESLRECGLPVDVLYDPRPSVSARPVPSGVGLRPVAHRGRGRWVVPVGLERELDPSTLVVLHSGYVLHNVVAGRVARRVGAPYVVTPHGAYDPHIRSSRAVARSAWELMERRLLAQAHAVHVFFPPEAEHVRDLSPRATTVVAATAADPTPFSWRAAEAEGYVAWLGRYDVRHKGLDRLLDAMQSLPRNSRPLLRLHGRDHKDTRASVERMVDDRDLAEHVRVGGPVDGDEKRRFLDNAAAYVHPARWESYGIALVENLTRGLPCVTTRDIHLAAELDRDRAAYVVEGTVAGLARGLRAAASGELDDYGRRGREFVLDHLSHQRAGSGFFGAIPADVVGGGLR